MTYCLHLDKMRKARVWMGDLPFTLNGGEQRILRVVAPPGASCSSRQVVALELFIPRGARALYGLLGASLTPCAGSDLVIRVPLLPPTARFKIDWSLAGRVDEVTSGLGSEYIEAVLETARLASEEYGLGIGMLDFLCAAEGTIGSCAALFRALTRSVVRLLRASADSPIESNAERIILEELARMDGGVRDRAY